MASVPLLARASHGQAPISDIDYSGMGTFSGSYTQSNTDHVWFVFNANAGNTITIGVNTAFGGGSHTWLYRATDGCAEVGDRSNAGLLLLQNVGSGSNSYTLTYAVPTTGQFAVQLDSWVGGSGAYNVTLAGSTAATVLCSSTTPTLATGVISGSPFCAGASVSVPFTATGTYAAGNVFTAQLSGVNGSFASFTNIGSVAGTTSGTISATIPTTTAAGADYHIRVVSSSPAVIGSENNSHLAVSARPTASLSGDATICAGSSTNLLVALTGTGPWSVTYTDGTTSTTVAATASPLAIAVSPGSSQRYRLTAVSDARCTGTSFGGMATVVVNSAPTVTAPADVTTNNDADQCGASVAFAATATGTPAPALAYSVGSTAISSPYLFPIGTSMVTATATNSCGSVSQTFSVTVNDTQLPTITAPAALSVSTDAGQCAASGVALGSAVANDNCAGVVVTNDAPASFPKGTTTVTWTATDAANNVATATQQVTVTDNEQPVLNVPTALVAAATATECGTVLTFAPAATDNCGGVTVVSSPASGSFFAVGTSTVTVTATDLAGNVRTETFGVTVNDQTAPTVQTRAVTVTLVNGSATVTPAQVDNGSSDACGITSLRLSRTDFSCANIGTQPVVLTVTDIHGNVASASAMVTVVGTIPTPTVVVTPSSAVYTGGMASTLYLGYGAQSATLTATGGGSGEKFSWQPAAGSPALSNSAIANPVFTATAAGTYAYTVTVTSATGCTATATVVLTVVDARCGNKNDKVLVCHNGHEICISPNAVNSHLTGHTGDRLGSCTTTMARAGVAATTGSPNELSAYPNPAADQATVSFRTMMASQAQVTVYNQLGQRVATLYEGPANGGQLYVLNLNSQELPAGLYQCQLVVNGKMETVRLAIAR